MKPHPQIRKTIKWGGTTLCALIALIWAASAWCTVFAASQTGHHWGEVGRGLVTIAFDETPVPGPWRAEWSATRHIGALHWRPSWDFSPMSWFVNVPLWIFAVITLLPTTIAWRLDLLARRRALTNHCPRCHYPLTGLTPITRCPECGDSRTTSSQ